MSLQIQVGDPFPSFPLPIVGGGHIQVKDFAGKKLVVYFYPKDNTPGCTREACAFRDEIGNIRKLGAEVVGVSRDSLESHDRFAQKYGLPFPLVSDVEGFLMKKTGVAGLTGSAKRTTFILNEQGIVQKIFENVKVDKHLQEVTKALEDTKPV